jgi:uncharacterized protein YyaL (SSP411 family)
MKYPITILASAAFITLVSCKSEPSNEEQSRTPPEIVPELQKNQLAGEPSAYLSVAAESKINWQPWSPEILEFAQKSQRMIIVMVGSARYTGCFEALEALEKNPTLVRRINQEYVPVLTDIDLTRETSLLAYNLSAETRTPVSFPFIILLSPEGNPVTWHSVQYQSDRDLLAFFDNSLEVIGRLWNDSPSYALSDSAEKAELRRDNLRKPDEDVPEMAERQRQYEVAMRQLGSYYDDDLNAMAGSGGLFPFGIFDSLTLAIHDQSLPESQRKLYRETLDSFVQTLLKSAMVDPLDGGIHPARRGTSWNLVAGRRECSSQARAGRILARMHQLGDYPNTLEAAINTTRYAEERFQTPDGLFSLSEKPDDSDPKLWLWTVAQVSSVLSDEEFKVWKNYSELNEIGNLPSEADPDRTYFRLNSLTAARTAEEVSQATGIDLDQVRTLIESGRKKLNKARADRVQRSAPDPSPSALASFRMVSCYAALYTATEDSSYLEKAIKLGKASREHFLKNRFLNERPDAEPEGSSDGRAFSYAVAVQAGLDLGAVTLEDEWYSWAQDLTTLLSEHFVTEQGRLMEVREVSKVVNIDYEDRMMVFDDSTAGLVRLNLQRLRAIGFQTPPALSPWLVSMPDLQKFPIVFTDSLIAISHEWNHTLVQIGPDAPEEVTNAVRTLPLQLFARRRMDSGGVKITFNDGREVEVDQADDIKSLLKKP